MDSVGLDIGRFLDYDLILPVLARPGAHSLALPVQPDPALAPPLGMRDPASVLADWVGFGTLVRAYLDGCVGGMDVGASAASA